MVFKIAEFVKKTMMELCDGLLEIVEKARKKMNVRITEQCPKKCNFKAGDKAIHRKLGKGIIVGFSEKTGNPVVFFYDAQDEFPDRVVCVFMDSISFAKED